MSAPARKPRPEAPAAADAHAEAPVPRLRPRHVREAEAAGAPVHGDPGEVRRLQDRITHAFTSPQPGSLERTLMKLIILAATCLFLRSAIAGLVGLTGVAG